MQDRIEKRLEGITLMKEANIDRLFKLWYNNCEPRLILGKRGTIINLNRLVVGKADCCFLSFYIIIKLEKQDLLWTISKVRCTR